MKLSCALALLFLTLTIKAQQKEIITRGDSLIVRDENIASNPFNFGRDPLAELKAMPNLPRPSIQPIPSPNRHVDNQVDTIFVLTFEQDSFRIYKGGDGENFLLYSQIKTNRFKTKHGIQVGMNKLQVKSSLKEYKLNAIPRYLILDNTEIIESMSLEFNNDVLVKIEFQGYFD